MPTGKIGKSFCFRKVLSILFSKKANPRQGYNFVPLPRIQCGGEGEIRTLETLAGLHDFQLVKNFIQRTNRLKVIRYITIIKITVSARHLK